MDALEFLKERKRICKSYEACGGCPLKIGNCGLSASMSDEEYEKIIAAVEQWSKENPRKTRQSVFLEQYPEAELDKNGVLRVCPAPISPKYRNDGRCATFARGCVECRKEYWMQEVE